MQLAYKFDSAYWRTMNMSQISYLPPKNSSGMNYETVLIWPNEVIDHTYVYNVRAGNE